MKRKLFNLIALACCFIFVMAVTADLSGKWAGIIKTPDGNDLPVAYNFKLDGEKLTGTCEGSFGQMTIDSGKVTGDAFKFQVTVDGNAYAHTGRFYADSCGLDIDFGGRKIHTTLKRVASK
ncbi:MAG: glycoside hydrolase [Mucilaginibacter sp.]|nr:glycoside hydrolase [Mucilaginibacter sp.]